jgi:hypothetical protein
MRFQHAYIGEKKPIDLPKDRSTAGWEIPKSMLD